MEYFERAVPIVGAEKLLLDNAGYKILHGMEDRSMVPKVLLDSAANPPLYLGSKLRAKFDIVSQTFYDEKELKKEIKRE